MTVRSKSRGDDVDAALSQSLMQADNEIRSALSNAVHAIENAVASIDYVIDYGEGHASGDVVDEARGLRQSVSQLLAAMREYAD